MPKIEFSTFLVVVFCIWAFGGLTGWVFTGLCIFYICWEGLRHVLDKHWGFVSRNEFERVRARNKKLKQENRTLRGGHAALKEEIEAIRAGMAVLKNTGIPSYVAEQYVRAGKDMAFKIYLKDRLLFNNMLADYDARIRRAELEAAAQKASAPEPDQPTWQSVLEVEPNVSADDARSAYRKLIKANHPDRATSEADRKVREARLSEINVAWDRAERHFGLNVEI